MHGLSIKSNWIINKKEDIAWLSGSMIVGYLFLSIFYLLQNEFKVSLYKSQLFVYFFWTFFLDGPHIFATYTRTYFDKSFRRKNKYLTYASLLILGIGPLIMLYFHFFHSKQLLRTGFLVFNRFGMLFAYYHLIRQHWGFVCIYNGINGGINKITRRLEALVLAFGTAYPLIFHWHHFKQPMGLAENLHISASTWPILGGMLLKISVLLLVISIFSYKRLKNIFNISIFILKIIVPMACLLLIFSNFGFSTPLMYVEKVIKYIFFASSVALIICYLSDYKQVNLPKLILLIIVVGSHNFILSLNYPYVVVYACLTMCHDLQYHRIIRYYNKNKYLDSEDNDDYGMATRVTKSILLFIILAVLFNFISTMPRAALGMFVKNELLYYLSATFFWGIAFHHYIIDSKIWRPSKDNDVVKYLKLRK